MLLELETFIAICSLINTSYGLYQTISGIFQGNKSKGQDVKKTVAVLQRSGISVNLLSNNTFYAPHLKAVTNQTQRSQHHLTNLRRVRGYLAPIQSALKQDILSSSMIPTPQKFLQEMRKNPWDVLEYIRPIQHTKPLTDSSYVPLVFEHNKIFYTGWIKRGLLPSAFNCSYNELWLPKIKTKNSVRKKLLPGYQDNINHGVSSNIYKKISNWYSQRTHLQVKQIINSGRYVDKQGNIIYKYTVYPLSSPSFEKPINSFSSIRRRPFRTIRTRDGKFPLLSPSFGERVNSYSTKDGKVFASYFSPLLNTWSRWCEI